MIPGNKQEDIETKDYCHKEIELPFLLSMKKEEKKEKGQRRKYDGPQENQTIIIKKLVYLINNYLKKPKIVYPFAGGLYKRKIAVLRDRTIFKKIPSAVQVIPQISIYSHDRPSKDVVENKGKKECNIGYINISICKLLPRIWSVYHHGTFID